MNFSEKETRVIDRQATWHIRAEKVVNRVCAVFPTSEFENWDLCEELVLSAVVTCGQINKFEIETEIAALLLDKTACYLSAKASYLSSFPLYQIGLTIRTKVSDILGWSSVDNMVDNINKDAQTAQSKDIYNIQMLQSSKKILDLLQYKKLV